MAASATYSNGVARIAKTILPADTTSYVDVYDNSAGTKWVTVEALNICNDDAQVNIAFARNDGAASFLIGTVRVATLAGTDGATARVNALGIGASNGDIYIGTLNASGIRVLEIPPGGKLQAKSLVAVNANKTVTITGWVRLYT